LHRSSDLTKLILIQQDSKKPFNPNLGSGSKNRGGSKKQGGRKQAQKKNTDWHISDPPSGPPSRIADVDTLRIHQNLTCFKKSPRPVKKPLFWTLLLIQLFGRFRGVKKSGFFGPPCFLVFRSRFRTPCFLVLGPQIWIEGFFGVLLNEDQLG